MSLDGRMRYARGMRGLLLVLLVSCTWSSNDGNAPGDPGEPDRPVRGHNGCQADRECSTGELCARTGSCLPASQIHAVHVNWTVRGMAASEAACSPSPDLEIDFRASDSDARFGYAPVPCVEGRFTVDKLPTKYTVVRLRHGSTWEMAPIDAVTGDAVFDLAL
jgi:hypothetical protein